MKMKNNKILYINLKFEVGFIGLLETRKPCNLIYFQQFERVQR